MKSQAFAAMFASDAVLPLSARTALLLLLFGYKKLVSWVGGGKGRSLGGTGANAFVVAMAFDQTGGFDEVFERDVTRVNIGHRHIIA